MSNSQATRLVGVVGRMREFLFLTENYRDAFVNSKNVLCAAILTQLNLVDTMHGYLILFFVRWAWRTTLLV